MKNKIKTYIVTGIFLTFSFYLLPLNAESLVASGHDPYVFFNDTNEIGGNEWGLHGGKDRFSLHNYDTGESLLWFDDLATMQLEMMPTTFQIKDQNDNSIVSVHRDALLSLDIQSDGDVSLGNANVSLAGGDVFINANDNRLGIGTTTPAYDLEIQSTAPSMFFDDTSAFSTDWYVGSLNNDLVFETTFNGTGGPSYANIMTLDAETGHVGIGTTTPARDLEIQSATPDMVFDDTDIDSADWWLGSTNNDFEVWTQDNATGGPAYTQIMTLDAETTFVGIGPHTPTAPLHVASTAGNAKILVEETGGAAARTLLQLKNNGDTKFGILNTEAGIEWILANLGTGLQFSRTGTGDVEMEILNNGNLVVAGGLSVASDVNSKTAFKDIDSHKILNKVAELPITKWEYKDALGEAHVGPMAQDFHAAFGLGATDTRISTIDADGVALVAIKALIEQNQ